jgi:catechol 2,3-dioxygenase-like lactoylglutathione lyase family enzyme
VNVLRFDHVGVIVRDLELTTTFFTDLGFVAEEPVDVVGSWMDRVIDLEDSHIELVVITAPDGSGRLELTKYIAPVSSEEPVASPADTLGFRHVGYVVADIAEIIGKAREAGYELVGEVADYEDEFRLAYIRGPEGLILEVAEALK